LIDLDSCGDAGITLCTQLKEGIATRNVPLVLLSSNVQKEETLNALLAGAEDYLVKPVFESDLLLRIDAHLRTRDYYEDLSHKDLSMLLELTGVISVTRNPARILSTIVDKIAESFDVARCSILNFDEEGELTVKASNDLKTNREIKLRLKKYPEIEQALSTRRPVVVRDIKTDPIMDGVRNEVRHLPFTSVFVVPIIKKQSVIGTFLLRTTSPLKDGTERIFKLCQVVADLAGNALENAILFESLHSTKKLLEDLAVRDSLTKLYNNQFFHSRLEDEFSRAKRYRLPLSCIFIDLDDFKRLNDQYGHIVGDVALKQVGRLIAQTLRKSDIAARFGGEEFSLLLTNTDTAGALELAERLRQMISELAIPQLKGREVTASIGVATFNVDNMPSAVDLLKSADHAMYQAKTAGRKNCVCQFSRVDGDEQGR
jgi:two-component system cell cycle response regulator